MTPAAQVNGLLTEENPLMVTGRPRPTWPGSARGRLPCRVLRRGARCRRAWGRPAARP
jgi:hypothetical protein